MDEDNQWVQYYQAVQGRPPRQLFLSALATFEAANFVAPGALAVDLGCGDGTETMALLAAGWQVLAVDQEPAAIATLLAKVPAPWTPRLQTKVAHFQDIALPEASFIYAGVSLPFCMPEDFPAVWAGIIRALRPGGCFAGHFFGDRDDWRVRTTMTFLTAAAVRQLLDGFHIGYFNEFEDDWATALGEMKHWHVIEVVARLPENQPQKD
jgi:SAM-dependent methyltransferase